ncbi:MAG: hypothetical protein KTR30_15605 [Saprospiraceae bacterium]|nr:hypothetical protein [Saprospiraceae bacterium]
MKHQTSNGLDHEHRLIEFFVMLDRKPPLLVAAFHFLPLFLFMVSINLASPKTCRIQILASGGFLTLS